PVPIVEFRKARNLLLHKIARNIVDILRLRRIMRALPARTSTRYHRWSREDVENLESAQTSLIIEMGRLHRGGALPDAPTTSNETHCPAVMTGRAAPRLAAFRPSGARRRRAAPGRAAEPDPAPPDG